MNRSKEEKKILIDLICHRQTRMIVKHPEIYASDEYRKLEALKVKIKDENRQGEKGVIVLLIWYLGIVIILFTSTVGNMDDYANTPKDIYESSTFNMFGCTIQFIFMVIFNPILYICKFVYWIFHAGRDDY